MLLKTHRAVSVAAGLAIITQTHQSLEYYILLIPIAIGASLPDIDTSSSLLGRVFAPISNRMRHRGYMHSLQAITLMWLLALFTKSLMMAALAFGYSAHVIEDGFSVQGVDWINNGWYLRFPFAYHVGGRFEFWVRLIARAYIVCALLSSFGTWSVSGTPIDFSAFF